MPKLWRDDNGQLKTQDIEAVLWQSTIGTTPDNGELNGFRLMPFQDRGSVKQLLLIEPGHTAYVNGQPVVGNLNVLRHKDEITIDSTRYVFSSESTPEVTTYLAEDPDQQSRCPICRGPILDGQQVVQCPGCQRIYHQTTAERDQPARECFTYGPTCRFCGHGTSLSSDGRWCPQDDEME